MSVPLLERLPRMLANGRRTAMRLSESANGRHRERATLHEVVRADCDRSTRMPASRVLCGEPALSLAALLAEREAGNDPDFGLAVLDLHAAPGADTLACRLERWIPRIVLARMLCPRLDVRSPADDHAVLQLVLEALDARGSDGSDETAQEAGALLLSDDTMRFRAMARPRRRWIACTPDSARLAQFRRTLVARGDVAFTVESVGTAPAEWARRNVGSQRAAAMHAVLAAWDAKPLPSPRHADDTRRRAGADALLGECRRDGHRTLVWVDPPDRRTCEATLCRAITRRDQGGWDRVLVLGWHVATTIGQHLAARCDSRIEVRGIRTLPRVAPSTAVRIDPLGFQPVAGLSQAWVDRHRSRTAGDVEWLTVQLGEHDAAIDDWSVDPAHDGRVFRGAWHAVREGGAGLRTMRLRVPWQDGPRRVCIRAVDACGRVSEVLRIVRDGPPATPGATSHDTCAAVPAEALC